MSDNAARLYKKDFVPLDRAAIECAARGAPLPYELAARLGNLAEEIESLGRSQRRELRSRLMAMLEPLLKLEHSPATDPRHGWMDTIERERSEIELLLQDSPSLGREVAQ